MRPPEHVAAALAALPRPVCAYVYDTAALRGRAAEVRAAFPAGTTLLYAVKANGHPDVVRTLGGGPSPGTPHPCVGHAGGGPTGGSRSGACDGLEVASGGELALALAAGARQITFGGPAKTDADLAAAVAAGARINVESGHELRRLARVAGPGMEISVRVNRASGHLPGSHAMSGAPTPFGVDERELPGVLALAARLPNVRVTGFHLHAASNNLDAAAHAAFVREAIAWSERAAADHGLDLRVINVGGGLGVDYLSDATLDLAALRRGLAGVTVPPGVELVVEPGRVLAADAGWYAAEVLDLKTTHGRTFAVLRGGTHHFRLPAAWGYSHPFTVLPVEEWPYDFDRPAVTGLEVDAVGELCTPRDVLTRGQRVDRLRVGDMLVFGRTGAYGWDISHHEFLRHDPPAFVIL